MTSPATQDTVPDLSPEPRRPDAGSPDLDHAGLGAARLTGRVLYTSDDLGQPLWIASVGPNLIVVDQLADSLILVIDKRSGTLVRRLGRRGEGPGEFKSIYGLDPVLGSNHEFWAYDLGLRRLTEIDLRDQAPAPPHYAKRSVTLASGTTLTSAVWAGSRIVTTGFFPDGRLTFFDSTGARRGVAGRVPPGNERTAPQVRQHAYQAYIAAKPSRNRLALLTRHLGQLELYDAKGRLLRTRSGPYVFEPRYAVRAGSDGQAIMATDIDLRFGYVNIATTDRAIIGLFSGRTRQGFPGAASFGEYLHVFDWDGRLRRVYRLDAPVLAIAVDTVRGELYAVRHEPEPAVLVYRIPNGALF